MKNNKYEFAEIDGLTYLKAKLKKVKKEESFLRAILAGVLLMIGLGLIFLIGIGIDNK